MFVAPEDDPREDAEGFEGERGQEKPRITHRAYDDLRNRLNREDAT